MKIDKDAVFYKTMFSFEPKVRAEIFKEADLGIDYMLKQVYVKGGNPVLRFSNALKLDRSSKGAFNAFLHGEGGPDMDLLYLRKAVNREIKARRQARLFAAPKTTKDVLTQTP